MYWSRKKSQTPAPSLLAHPREIIKPVGRPDNWVAAWLRIAANWIVANSDYRRPCSHSLVQLLLFKYRFFSIYSFAPPRRDHVYRRIKLQPPSSLFTLSQIVFALVVMYQRVLDFLHYPFEGSSVRLSLPRLLTFSTFSDYYKNIPVSHVFFGE
jgi:hypothetical protein